MRLRQLLEGYRKISFELIKEIKEEANVSELMDKRGKIIDEIVESDFSKEEKIKIGKEVNILDVEKMVKVALEEEQRKVKEEIREMHIKKQANIGYGKNINSINFFNRKV